MIFTNFLAPIFEAYAPSVIVYSRTPNFSDNAPDWFKEFGSRSQYFEKLNVMSCPPREIERTIRIALRRECQTEQEFYRRSSGPSRLLNPIDWDCRERAGEKKTLYREQYWRVRSELVLLPHS